MSYVQIKCCRDSEVGEKIASSIRNAKCDMNQKLQAQDEFKIKEGEDGPLVTTAQAKM